MLRPLVRTAVHLHAKALQMHREQRGAVQEPLGLLGGLQAGAPLAAVGILAGELLRGKV